VSTKKRPRLRDAAGALASKFIAEEVRTHKYPRKQAVAIGLSRARREARSTKDNQITKILRDMLQKY
jgi:hypothetical protein